MTQEETAKLLKELSALEIRAQLLTDEISKIKKVLVDIIDPENKKAQVNFARQRKRYEKKAHIEIEVQRILEKRRKRLEQSAERQRKKGGNL